MKKEKLLWFHVPAVVRIVIDLGAAVWTFYSLYIFFSGKCF